MYHFVHECDPNNPLVKKPESNPNYLTWWRLLSQKSSLGDGYDETERMSTKIGHAVAPQEYRGHDVI